LNVDINHIGVQQMTKTSTPLALMLAALTFVTLWAPTLAAPAAAETVAISLPALA
jgi:hypothetical protein